MNRSILRPVSTVARETLRSRGDESTAGRSASTGVHATLIVLDALAGATGPMQLSDLTRELTVPKSTIHRICAVLVERGWAVRGDEGGYSLGIRALRLGSRSNDLPMVTAFRTVAAEFLTRHDEMLALAVLDGEESLFIAIEETSQPGTARHSYRLEDAGLRLRERARHPGDAPPGPDRRPLCRAAARHADGTAAERRARAADLPG